MKQLKNIKSVTHRMTRTLRLCALLIPFSSFGQNIDLDVFGGMCNYQGDLQPQFFTLTNLSPGGAVILKYGLNKNIYIRAGFAFGSVAGSDKYNRVELRSRNLNFRSSLQEFSLGGEWRIINPDKFSVTPYVLLGVGVFHYNPYTFFTDPATNKTERVYLRPLSTEGQGLEEYPERKPYSLTQFCIPYGVGIKWQINCNLNLGIEFRHTKIFTDYLDDVSTTYVDEEVLRNRKGQQAVNLAWRRDEIDGRPYPANALGFGRGNPKEKDWYYFAGLTLGLKLNDCETGQFSLGGLFRRSGYGGGRKRSRLGCPTNVY